MSQIPCTMFQTKQPRYWYLSSLLLEECFLLFPLSFVHCHHCSILLEVWPQACLNPGYHGNLPVQQQTMVHRENHQNHHPFDPYFELKKLSNLFLKVYSNIKNADLLKNYLIPDFCFNYANNTLKGLVYVIFERVKNMFMYISVQNINGYSRVSIKKLKMIRTLFYKYEILSQFDVTCKQNFGSSILSKVFFDVARYPLMWRNVLKHVC